MLAIILEHMRIPRLFLEGIWILRLGFWSRGKRAGLVGPLQAGSLCYATLRRRVVALGA
jgi:hypothetical protein